MSAKSIFWQKMWNTPQNVLPQQTHQCLTRQWYQERKPSSSFSFCKVLVLTNLIGQEEMRLMKYTFLVFSMGQFIWRAIGLLLLPSTRKLKVFLAVKKQMPTIQYNTELGKTQIAAVVSFQLLRFYLWNVCFLLVWHLVKAMTVSKGSLHLKRLQQHFCLGLLCKTQDIETGIWLLMLLIALKLIAS